MRLARSPLSTRVDRLARSIGDLQDIRPGAEGEGRGAEGHGTAYRHQHSCPRRFAGSIRTIKSAIQSIELRAGASRWAAWVLFLKLPAKFRPSLRQNDSDLIPLAEGNRAWPQVSGLASR